MRAYVFADTLGRTLSFKGYKLRHIVNITDVGHLTSDADAGDDKMEKAAAAQGRSAWDIAAFYTAEFKRDLQWLGVRNRSEEHTSELQSLMRISYAVFCLKKKKKRLNAIDYCAQRVAPTSGNKR